MKRAISLIIAAALFIGCGEIDRYPGADEFAPGENTENPGNTDNPENPDNPDNPGGTDTPTPPPAPTYPTGPVTTATIGDEGLSYIWDEGVIPEITIAVSLEEWNKLLKAFDQNPNNKDYFHCNLTYKKGSDVHNITDEIGRAHV